MDLAEILDRLLSAVCPIYGVSVGRVNDKATWKFSPKPEATVTQIAAATKLLDDVELAKVLRRPRGKAPIKAEILALNPGQRQQLWNDVQAEMMADYLIRNPTFATDRGVNIPGDEPEV